MIGAISVFAGSLIGIFLLFLLKSWEVRRGQPVAERLRARADRGALRFKDVLIRLEYELYKIPPTTAALMRFGVHIGAMNAARISRAVEEGAYDLADLVSHKHRFERRETKSQFLKDVAEHKNGNGAKQLDIER